MSKIFYGVAIKSDKGDITITFPDLPGIEGKGAVYPEARFNANEALLAHLKASSKARAVEPTASEDLEADPATVMAFPV